MYPASQDPRQMHFACTQCGACCNRSPEVGLSEAAALADVFVFRLMFRLYDLPRKWAPDAAGPASAEFYESKRLLAAFAARKYPVRRKQERKTVEYSRYLTISALTVQSAAGSCAALRAGRCGIYDRRPLACRTVPFHYSRPEAAAGKDFEAFVGTVGYGCDISPRAPVVLRAGQIVDPQVRQARSAALETARRDRRWGEAIVRRLKDGGAEHGLPSLREIEANAAYGATTVSMGVAWRIAAEADIIDAEACRSLIGAQAALIDRELEAPGCDPEARETLAGMRGEYLRGLAR